MFKPFFLLESLLNGYKFVYTFQSDFDIADHFGAEAVKYTFNRAFNEWKSDIVAVSEIECVLNLRCWFWYEHGNEDLSRLYSDLFTKFVITFMVMTKMVHHLVMKNLEHILK